MVSLEGESLVGLVAVGTVPAVALTAMFVGSAEAGAVAIVGWLLLVPVVGILTDDEEFEFGDEDEQQESAAESDPLDELRRRYAEGELTDAEFERRLERLLETEDMDVPSGATVEPSPERERQSAERTVERER
jgi:uncharacterized membrane protein